jgi:hypothetical protein
VGNRQREEVGGAGILGGEGGRRIGRVGMETHSDGVVPEVMGRQELEVGAEQAGIFTESGSGEKVRFPIRKAGQRDSADSVTDVGERECRRVPDRQ